MYIPSIYIEQELSGNGVIGEPFIHWTAIWYLELGVFFEIRIWWENIAVYSLHSYLSRPFLWLPCFWKSLPAPPTTHTYTTHTHTHNKPSPWKAVGECPDSWTYPHSFKHKLYIQCLTLLAYLFHVMLNSFKSVFFEGGNGMGIRSWFPVPDGSDS